MDLRLARRELKFILDQETATRLVEDIGAHLPADSHASGGGYSIFSQYYDSPDRECFWQHDRKFANRRKMRVRIYRSDDSSRPANAFVEIKHKQTGVGVKRRLSLPVEEICGPDFDLRTVIDRMDVGTLSYLDAQARDEFARMLVEWELEPVVQLRYFRKAYQSTDGVRITFDSEIGCRFDRRIPQHANEVFPMSVLPTDQRLMEVKIFGAAPYWLRELSARHRLIRSSFSKYSTAVRKYDSALAAHFSPSV